MFAIFLTWDDDAHLNDAVGQAASNRAFFASTPKHILAAGAIDYISQINLKFHGKAE